MTKKGLADLVVRLSMFESKTPMDEARTVDYAEALVAVPDDLVMRAMVRLRAVMDWRPSPAAVLKAIVELIDPPPPAEVLISDGLRSRHGAVEQFLSDIGGRRVIADMKPEQFAALVSRKYEESKNKWMATAAIALSEGSWESIERKAIHGKQKAPEEEGL